MTLKGQTLLKGHSLRFEGQALYGGPNMGCPTGKNGRGQGRCSCGEWSPVLGSSYQRKQWHRQHKDEIRAKEVIE